MTAAQSARGPSLLLLTVVEAAALLARTSLISRPRLAHLPLDRLRQQVDGEAVWVLPLMHLDYKRE